MPAGGAEREVGNEGVKAAAHFELGERKRLPDDDDATPNGAGPKTVAEVVVNGWGKTNADDMGDDGERKGEAWPKPPPHRVTVLPK